MENLNDRLRAVFNDSGLTQMEISKKLKIAQSSVSSMISGKIKPSNRTLDDISERFDVNLEWLKTGEGPMKKEHQLKKELADFFSEIIKTDVPYRDEFISALSHLEPEHWEIIGKLIMETAEKIKSSEEKRK